MARRLNNAKSLASTASRRGTRAQTRSTRASRNEPPPDVYQELLSEAATSVDEDSRPMKRRKTTATPEKHSSAAEERNTMPQQTAYDDSPTSDESDVDWQDISLQNGQTTDDEPSAADRAAAKDILVVIGETRATPRKSRMSNKLPSSAVEKKKRLEIHKLHVLCLLAHVYTRNAWCNNTDVQSTLKPLLNKRMIAFLDPNPEFSQFRRSESFFGGLQQAIDAFRPMFKILSRGTRRPQWVTDPSRLGTTSLPSDSEKPLDRGEFIKAAKKRAGSRDLGAQLFCAMLRRAGVDARLVCSLQPLSFASAPPAQKPQNPKRTVNLTNHDSDNLLDTGDESAGSMASLATSVGDGIGSASLPRRIKRFGISTSRESPVDLGEAPSTPVKSKKFVESHFPVYWVEAFNMAHQKWVPVDPLVTGTINKPHKIEPPASDSLNDMSYVVAFNEDGSMKDVTRRYTKAYNAKTRRIRADSTKEGQRWWKKSLRVFKGEKEDRDQVEDAELANKEAAEPMPRNVQDFKDHPYYALERHLRHNEIIRPKREVGKLNTGKAADAVESIYRRRDVQVVKTADKWYRTAGREVKSGEQPLKYATRSRGRRQRSVSANSDASEEAQGVGLYARFQTEIYVPPLVQQGRIPKNAFGNLDIYVSSMIPPGGVHVRAAETAKAAGILGIDFADAVTGFDFRGRRGTAVVKGAVVAKEYAEAVEEVVRALRWQKELEVQKKKSAESLRLWKRFLVGLRVRERVMSYEISGGGNSGDVQAQIDEMEDQEEKMVAEGGFLPDQDQPVAQPTAGVANDATTQTIDFAETGISDVPEHAVPAVDYEDLHMSVYSPWDAPGSLSNHPRAPARSQLPSNKPGNASSGDNSIHQKRDPAEEEQGNRDEGGGGFLFSDEDEEDIEPKARAAMQHPQDFTSTAIHEEPSAVNNRGGFMPVDHDDHTEGGGFIVEDSVEAGGFVIDDDVEAGGFSSATEERAVYGRSAIIPPPPPDQAGVEPTMIQEAELASDNVEQAVEVSEEVERASAGGKGDATSNNGGERGMGSPERGDAESLLSEDPEDEDAEPEWLQ